MITNGLFGFQRKVTGISIFAFISLFILLATTGSATALIYDFNNPGIDTSQWNTTMAGSFFSQPGDGFLHVDAPSANAINTIYTQATFESGVEFWGSIQNFSTGDHAQGELSGIHLCLGGLGNEVYISRYNSGSGMYLQATHYENQMNVAFTRINSTAIDFQFGIQWFGPEVLLSYKEGLDPNTPSIPLLFVNDPGFVGPQLFMITAEARSNQTLSAEIGAISVTSSSPRTFHHDPSWFRTDWPYWIQEEI